MREAWKERCTLIHSTSACPLQALPRPFFTCLPLQVLVLAVEDVKTLHRLWLVGPAGGLPLPVPLTHIHLTPACPLQVLPRPFFTCLPLQVPVLAVEGGSKPLESDLMLFSLGLDSARLR